MKGFIIIIILAALSFSAVFVILAQVCFFLGDLRRESLFYALWWRRSHPFFHTCAKR